MSDNLSKVRVTLFSRVRNAATRPGVAVFASSVSTNLVRLLSTLLLTRLLSPADFGAMLIVSAVNYMMIMATDLGFEQFVIRSREGADRHFLDAIWTLRLFRGLLIGVFIVALSGPLSHVVAKPELQAAIAFGAFAPILAAGQSMGILVAERSRQVAVVLAFNFGVLVVQTAACLLFATQIRSYWAMLYGTATCSILSLIASYALFPNSARRFKIDKKIGRDLLAFGRFYIVPGLLVLVVTQADKFVLGRSLSIDTFGLYALATSLTSAGAQMVMTFGRTVQLPLYAQTHRESPESLQDIFYKSRRKMAALIGFLMGGGAGGSETIILLLYEDHYAGAAPMFALLCLAPLCALGALCSEALLVTLGRLWSTTEAVIVRMVWIAAMTPLALTFGGPLALVAVFATHDFAVYVYYCFRVAQRGYFRLSEEALPFATAAVGAAVGWFGGMAIRAMVAAGILPDF